MGLHWFIWALTFCSGISAHYRQNFTGHKLLGMMPKNPSEVETLRNFMEDPEIEYRTALKNKTIVINDVSAIPPLSQVDFWMEPTREMQNVTVHVPPESASKLENTMKHMGMQFYTITDNLQEWIDREREENHPDGHFSGRTVGFPLDAYHPLDEIIAYLHEVNRKHPNLTKLIELGDTYEGNIILVLKISSGGNDTRPAVWIDAGIHSREWVAPASALYMIDRLITGYGTDKELTSLIDNNDWYILPVVNPDGYLHTWNWNRLWRKNRALIPSFPGVLICRGTDPNRNFDIYFGGPSTSSTPCSAIFKGDFAFSEAESSAIRDGVTAIKDRLRAYFTLHSFSQIWMTPHGYTTMRAPHYNEHMEILKLAVAAVEATHGMPYRYGPSAETLYATSGSASDWVYDKIGCKYSFSIELRDRGVFGFLLPRSEIIPTAEETWAGIKTVVSHLHLRDLEKIKKDEPKEPHVANNTVESL